jgi:hypothetical protein
MSRTVDSWTDARLDDLAHALEPIPPQVAALTATVRHLHDLTQALEPMPAQVGALTAAVANLEHLAAELKHAPVEIAVLAAVVERLGEENRDLREELVAMQRQLLQVAWGLVAALLGAAAALSTVLL